MFTPINITTRTPLKPIPKKIDKEEKTGEAISREKDNTKITDKKDNEAYKNKPGKPTLDNMNVLYSLFLKALKSEEDTITTKCLEEYIKDNNLDVSADNLIEFFADVKANTPGGMLAQINYLNKRFQDYIENGYNPNGDTETNTPDGGDKPVLSSEQVLALLEAQIKQNLGFGTK